MSGNIPARSSCTQSPHSTAQHHCLGVSIDLPALDSALMLFAGPGAKLFWLTNKDVQQFLVVHTNSQIKLILFVCGLTKPNQIKT